MLVVTVPVGKCPLSLRPSFSMVLLLGVRQYQPNQHKKKRHPGFSIGRLVVAVEDETDRACRFENAVALGCVQMRFQSQLSIIESLRLLMTVTGGGFLTDSTGSGFQVQWK
uniref:Uncharacterized protein n=1 Tax=Setaria digitata TaxID=48799 RepID=A0A915PNL4_9BILA